MSKLELVKNNFVVFVSVSDSSSTRQITLITINGLTLTSESTFTLPNGVSASQCSDKVRQLTFDASTCKEIAE